MYAQLLDSNFLMLAVLIKLKNPVQRIADLALIQQAQIKAGRNRSHDSALLFYCITSNYFARTGSPEVDGLPVTGSTGVGMLRTSELRVSLASFFSALYSSLAAFLSAL